MKANLLKKSWKVATTAILLAGSWLRLRIHLALSAKPPWKASETATSPTRKLSQTIIVPATDIGDVLLFAQAYACVIGATAREKMDEIVAFAKEHPGELTLTFVTIEIPSNVTLQERLCAIGRSIAFAAARNEIISIS